MDMCVLCDSCKSYYDINNNSEKKKFCRKCYMKQWNIDNRELIKEQKKQWRIDNRQRLQEQKKQWDIDNPEKMTISNWKRNGLIELEGVYTYQSLYEYYLSINECEVCNKKFKNNQDRCMDHSHITGLFRWVLCRSCNTCDKWMDLI